MLNQDSLIILEDEAPDYICQRGASFVYRGKKIILVRKSLSEEEKKMVIHGKFGRMD